MSASFPRKSRLTQRAEFNRVFSAPHQRNSDRYFTVLGHYYVCNPPQLRLGLVVAKKRIAKSHDRNRIKRIVRESFRYLTATEKSIDIIVMPKTLITGVDNDVLFVALAKHWQRLLQ